MNEKEAAEMITLFMGSKLKQSNKQISESSYYESYDCLMPVWHKFRDLRFNSDNIKYEQNIRTFQYWRDKIQNAILNYDSPSRAFLELSGAIQWLNTLEQFDFY